MTFAYKLVFSQPQRVKEWYSLVTGDVALPIKLRYALGLKTVPRLGYLFVYETIDQAELALSFGQVMNISQGQVTILRGQVPALIEPYPKSLRWPHNWHQETVAAFWAAQGQVSEDMLAANPPGTKLAAWFLAKEIKSLSRPVDWNKSFIQTDAAPPQIITDEYGNQIRIDA